ncbi:MAG: peptide/nickel transport system permease protein [Bryobacterales bacterium]|nr:peptide/nickel transport system permease protein [Bryobacterales bacterium]
MSRSFLVSAFKGLLNLALIVLVGGFAAAALVRYSPGFDVDENSWNPKISAATLAAMHARREQENQLPRFYAHYLGAALHGDLGKSDSLRVPVADLLRDRAPVTLNLVTWGTAGGLLFGASLAWMAVWPRRTAPHAIAVSANGLLLAIPPAVLGLMFFFAEAPLALAVALALMPRVFGTMRALFQDLYASPVLLAARTRGVHPAVLAFRYVLGAAAPQLLALSGVALVLAFGFIIPIEALCDVPGIGQLAWKAALARDLPLLSGMALIITLVTACVQTVGDLTSGAGR